ncbi:MAG: PQQ-binding-like beta-propeller repeat protein [Verrucomicrobiales bacterium]|nr:PQQ-binding-like beta-propeller repeat protein [Verrucomicrobiales bacterium]
MNQFSIGILLAAGIVGCGTSLGGENWPRFRGENGEGIVKSADIPPVWEESDFAWKVQLPGSGNGSPVVWGDRIFLLTAKGKTVSDAATKPAPENSEKGAKKKKPKAGPVPQTWIPVCVSAKDGSVIWQKEFEDGSFKGHKFNSAASSTPAVDSKRVIFTWGTADQLTMVAFSHDGEKLWEADLGTVNGGHGFGASPILIGDLVVLNNDQERGNGNLLAVNADTGDVAWTVDRKSLRISYSVPCVFESGGRKLLMFTNWQHGFTVVDPASGAVVAEKSVFNTDTNERAISSPVVAGDLVIGTCGFTANPKHCVAMRLDGDELEEVWRIERNVPHIPCVLVVDTTAYLWDDSGICTAVEAATGEELWKARIPEIEGKVFGSPVSDGEKIFCADESGNVHVIAASPEGLTVLGKNRLDDLCRTTPAIAGNRMYVRTSEHLFAVKGR